MRNGRKPTASSPRSLVTLLGGLGAIALGLWAPAAAQAESCSPSFNSPTGPLPGSVIAPNLRVVKSFGFGASGCGALRIVGGTTSTALWAWDNSDGLWKSTDDGANWTKTYAAAPYKQIENVLPLSNGRVLILVRDSADVYHVLRSTDSTGTSFGSTPVLDIPPGGRLLGSESWTETGGAIYIAEYGDADPPIKLWKSTDGGQTFSVVYELLGVRHFHSVQADPYDAGRIWVNIGDGASESRVGYSDDGGETFTFISQAAYPESRVVSLMFAPDAVYWGTDTPDVPSELFRWDRQTGRTTTLLTGLNGPFYYGFGHDGAYVQFSGVERDSDSYIGDQYYHVLSSNGGSEWSATRTILRRDPLSPSTTNSVILGHTRPDAEGRFWVNFWNLEGSVNRTSNIQFQIDPSASADSPRASFTATPAKAAPGQAVAFDGTASASPAGGLTYRWTWGDGTPAGSGATPSHAFASPGTYEVRLQVTDAAGDSAETTRQVVVSSSAFSAPGAVTSAASDVTTTGALLRGSASPNGTDTTVRFEYGTTTSYGSQTPPQAIGSGTAYQAHAATVSGLQPNTTYHYRLVATNAAGTTYGADRVLRTSETPPTVTTDPASDVGSDSARLHATVDPNGLATTVRFEYGTTASYGSQTPPLNAGDGTSPQSLDTVVANLQPNTTYHYRVVATSSGGTAVGVDRTFTTSAAPPLAVTESATAVTESSATLNGTVDARGQPATVRFEYGTTTAYGSQTSPQAVTANLVPNAGFEAGVGGWSTAGTAPATFARQTGWASAGAASARFTTANLASGGWSEIRVDPYITGIQPGTQYSIGADINVLARGANQYTVLYVVWRDASGASLGKVEVAWTNALGVRTLSGTKTAPAGAVMAQVVLTIEGAGVTDLYVDEARLGAGGGASQSVSAPIAGLQPATTYHYRVVVTTEAGTVHGADRTFTTTGGSPPPTAPSASTEPASGVSATAATLEANVNPNSSGTVAYFEYGTTTLYGTRTADQSMGAGTSTQPLSAAVSGLEPGTTYHYRVVATNAAGTTFGQNRSFTTPSAPPTGPGAITDPATAITGDSATLNGTVDPRGLSTTVRFEYGPTAAYGSQTPTQALSGNLVPNDSFETDLAGWSSAGTAPATFERQSGWSSAGAAAARFTTGSVPSGGFSEVRVDPAITGVQAGETYAVSADVNLLSRAEGQWAVLYVVWRDASGASLGKVEVAYTNALGVRTLSGERTAPAGAARAQVVVTVEGAGVMDLYIDDVRLGNGAGGPQSVSAQLTGLAPGQTYHYRVVATSAAGTTHGADRTFTTTSSPAPQAPDATTDPATGVSATGATFNATVDPNGLATTVRFEYGTTLSYGSQTPEQSAGAGSASQSLSSAVAGLQPGTTYNFRVVATSSAGTTFGANRTVTTPAAEQPPTATTSNATSISATGATLRASINPRGLPTTVVFQYGTTTAYGSETSPQSAGSGTTSQTITRAVTGLLPNTTYNFRVVATNAAGSTVGANRTFTTSRIAPTVTTAAPVVVGNLVELRGTVNPNGTSTTWRFEYGRTTRYGSTTPTTSAGAGHQPVSVAALTSTLTPGVTYHARLVATNTAGTTRSADFTFTGP